MASAVRTTPYTVQGWRPTSAVYQPVNMAMYGKAKVRNVHNNKSRLRSMRSL